MARTPADETTRTRARAAVLRELRAPLSLEDIAVPEPGPAELRVRIRGVGICHTDLSATDGTMPRPLPAVLGHEGAGVVEAVGDGVTEVAVGDHVVLSFDHCRSCRWCAAGRPAYCDAFVSRNYSGTRMLGGGVHGAWFGQSSFASLALCGVNNAVRVDPALPIELLGPFGCGFLTGAGTVRNVLRPEAGDGIAVFGLGSVGLAAVMAAKAAGCDPIVGVDPNPARRELGESLGVTHAFDPSATERLGKAIRAVSGGGGVACSLDAVGTAEVVDTALKVLRSPGLCATVGFRGHRNVVSVDQGHLLFGRGLVGVIEGDADPHALIPDLLALHARGGFPFERLITTFPFEQINEALAAVAAGDVVKPVLVF